MKNSLRIHKWTHNEFNIFILGVLTRPHFIRKFNSEVVHHSIDLILYWLVMPIAVYRYHRITAIGTICIAANDTMIFSFALLIANLDKNSEL